MNGSMQTLRVLTKRNVVIPNPPSSSSLPPPPSLIGCHASVCLDVGVCVCVRVLERVRRLSTLFVCPSRAAAASHERTHHEGEVIL